MYHVSSCPSKEEELLKKMGTFKDISLFGNLIFPLQGEFAGGIIAHSLAGIDKVVKKT